MHFPKCPDIPTQTPFAPTRIQDPPNRQTPLSSNLDYLPPSTEPPHHRNVPKPQLGIF
ncbi:hypothetical protein EV359DRAFT_87484 [Lentinula novae-zelandiae]|nr:hypothetical protein EV359DRAFT_87484 [Lentinula novae-zelandiae]